MKTNKLYLLLLPFVAMGLMGCPTQVDNSVEAAILYTNGNSIEFTYYTNHTYELKSETIYGDIYGYQWVVVGPTIFDEGDDNLEEHTTIRFRRIEGDNPFYISSKVGVNINNGFQFGLNTLPWDSTSMADGNKYYSMEEIFDSALSQQPEYFFIVDSDEEIEISCNTDWGMQYLNLTMPE